MGTSNRVVVAPIAAILLAALAIASTARADTLKLKSGKTLHGKIVSRDGALLRFRTPLGVMDVPQADIDSIEEGPAPWEEYDRVRPTFPDTADDQARLGEWCRDHGLEPQARKHFQRAIELDADHAAARSALGFKRHGTLWVRPSDVQRANAKPPASKPARATKPAKAVLSPEEKLIRELIGKYTARIKAIYIGRLDQKDPSSKLFEDGRNQILAIHDPLAIPAISSVLSKGRHRAVRELMVEALSRFKEDEATMNLVVVTLLDPDPMVRRRAALTLVPRKDDRIVSRLRKALSSNEDTVVRNAAVALGILRAREAVEDLALVLYTVERRNVRYARTEIIGDVWQAFNGQVLLSQGQRQYAYRPSVISVLSNGTAVGTTWVDEVRDVTFYRTDVQEALIHITGVNFGFDADAWIAWSQKNPMKKP